MPDNAHFESFESWQAARARLTFEPLVPRDTAGSELQSLSIHVRDHKLRELPAHERSLEAHYGSFVLSQVGPGAHEAKRRALEVSYGSGPRELRIAGHEARVYELGPEVPPDDVDGRSPAVVVWHDGTLFLLVASGQFEAEALIAIATSLYP